MSSNQEDLNDWYQSLSSAIRYVPSKHTNNPTYCIHVCDMPLRTCEYMFLYMELHMILILQIHSSPKTHTNMDSVRIMSNTKVLCNLWCVAYYYSQ